MEILQFEWDKENIDHLAVHRIMPTDAEELIRNRPVDLEWHIRNNEERVVQIGETDAGRILIVVSTTVHKKIRVVTAWPAKERLRRYFDTQKRNGNVGRIEEQDLRE